MYTQPCDAIQFHIIAPDLFPWLWRVLPFYLCNTKLAEAWHYIEGAAITLVHQRRREGSNGHVSWSPWHTPLTCEWAPSLHLYNEAIKIEVTHCLPISHDYHLTTPVAQRSPSVDAGCPQGGCQWELKGPHRPRDHCAVQ